eukprot:GHUV01022771.1.p1 GENE.GHUV01022771.1~~GHUV01022771.1.p1  ORF type:complete len:137 (+),score=24.06 GHUV01022771.1:55-411(+)
MGVQCFQEELLQICGRSHTLADVYAAIDAVKTAGMPSWSLDLISGLPKLTLDKWKYSLDQAIAADPDHISVYDLQVGALACLVPGLGCVLYTAGSEGKGDALQTIIPRSVCILLLIVV